MLNVITCDKCGRVITAQQVDICKYCMDRELEEPSNLEKIVTEAMFDKQMQWLRRRPKFEDCAPHTKLEWYKQTREWLSKHNIDFTP